METTSVNTLKVIDPKQAAYGLNVCTVSASQIIDFNDIYVLNQEYKYILNNINLENYPTDENLLEVWSQLLDTIHAFNIQELQKELLEKQYQQKMKDAIWQAVPNFAVIFGGGNPATIAVTAAMQVGLGYMNYRRAKSSYQLEKEEKDLELHINALDMFHGIRSSLFKAAWALADKYNYKDALRLTEEQINEFNKTLLETNPLKRYKRLENIAHQFEAFPVFWYHLGSSAREVMSTTDAAYDSESYREKALAAYEKFGEIYPEFFREDIIAASCFLEHISLLDSETERETVLTLLKKVGQLAGDNKDVLQITAFILLSLKEEQAFVKIVERLVLADYNLALNGPLLSQVYIKNNDRKHYRELLSLIPKEYLTPWEEVMNQDTVNIMVAGKSGIGKSTLLNAVFGEDRAKEVAVGARGTTKNQWWAIESKPVKIYDTVGLEAGTADQIKQDIKSDLEHMKAESLKNRLHGVWYCIHSDLRMEEFEEEFIKELYREYGLPIFVVLTQAKSTKKAEALKADIEDRLSSIVKNLHVHAVIAKPLEVEFEDEIRMTKAKGISELVMSTIENIPADYRDALVVSLGYNTDQKKRLATKEIKANVYGGKNIFEQVGTWFARAIPLANAVETAARLAYMEKNITKIYEIDLTDDRSDYWTTVVAVTLAGLIPLLNIGLMSVAVEQFGEEMQKSAEEVYIEAQMQDIHDKHTKAKLYRDRIKDRMQEDRLRLTMSSVIEK